MHNKGNIERVLVIVLAETRAHELTFERFKHNLLDVVDGDLALCVANNEREETDNPFYKHARYTWIYNEPEDWGDAFDEACAEEKGDPNWRKILQIKDQWLGGIKGKEEHPGSAGILLYFRWFLKQQLEREQLVKKYDRFIITRSDFMHQAPHVLLTRLNPSYIWIPEGEFYGGYTDRHIVLSAEHVLEVLSIADDLVKNPDRLINEMQDVSCWNLERFIKFSFKRRGISSLVRYFPYTMFSVRAPNGATRWSKGKYSDELGFFIKYKGEYKRAIVAAKYVEKPEHWTWLQFHRLRMINHIISWREEKPIRKFRKRIKAKLLRLKKK